MRFVAALPDFVIAGVALLTWIDPSILGEQWAGYFLTLMLLEFIVVHSAAFLGLAAFSDAPKATRVKQVLGLSAFYSLFGAAISFGAKAWWPLLAGAFATVLLPLPELGVRSSMLGPIGEDSGGIWVDEPHRVIAFAFLYFVLAGTYALLAHRSTPIRPLHS